MEITIDGPAGVGKSTISALVAAELGFQLLDTGSMYRTLTLAAQQNGVCLSDPDKLSEFSCAQRLAMENGTLLLDRAPVGEEIRDPKVTKDVHYVADNIVIRKFLVCLQREIGQSGKIVAEGRDQGTVVFPNAFCKFFLTATDEVRAKRRVDQLMQKNTPANFSEVLSDQQERDRKDQSRPVGKLMKAIDAITIDTSDLSIKEVVEKICAIVKKKQASVNSEACC